MINCPFCIKIVDRRIAAYGTMFVIYDNYPVSEGHTLIVPIRHVDTVFNLTETEIRDAFELVNKMKQMLSDKYRDITGWNVGANCGASAGQTIMHCHIHLIPRRNGDTPNPRGGIRGVIPNKMDY